MRNTKEITFDSSYPSIADLRARAKKRVPGFAFDYLDGGCNDNVNLMKNIRELSEVELVPSYLERIQDLNLRTSLFGVEYDAPFGVAPVGLQGLIWPNSPEILAKAAFEHNVPFILSTVTTSSIERIAEVTDGKSWFQLYNPVEDALRDDIISRLERANFPVLVLLCDTPSFGFRPKEIKNGLSLPPRMTLKNVLQVLSKPQWAYKTLIHGQPSFETLRPYMPKGLSLRQLGQFMNQTFSGRLDEEKIKPIRDKWKGKLVLKGVASEADVQKAIQLGLDGVIVSNHGGRQLDAGESTIKSLTRISDDSKRKITVMMDGGIRSGTDVARSLALGAEFTFMGRAFMYGVGAMGNKGGDHTISLLKVQLKQVMDQLSCERVSCLKRRRA